MRGQAGAAATKATGLAQAEAVKARGLAEAEAAKAKGLAEAEAIRARSQALAENQEAVIAQQLAENWPEIVEAASKSFGNVDHMIVLNGAQGVEELLAKALTLGGTGLGLARTLLSTGPVQPPVPASPNGTDAPAAPPSEPPLPAKP